MATDGPHSVHSQLDAVTNLEPRGLVALLAVRGLSYAVDGIMLMLPFYALEAAWQNRSVRHVPAKVSHGGFAT